MTSVFQASIETDKGSFLYRFDLGTDEAIARDTAKDLCESLIWDRRLGDIVVKTVGLIKNGLLIDTFDGHTTRSETK